MKLQAADTYDIYATQTTTEGIFFGALLGHSRVLERCRLGTIKRNCLGNIDLYLFDLRLNPSKSDFKCAIKWEIVQ